MGTLILTVVFLGLFGSVLVWWAGWVLFEKANQPGWAILVPFYNLIVALRIADLSPDGLVLLLIPGVNVVYGCYVGIRIAKAFDKSWILGVSLALYPYVFVPILAFSDTDYDVNRIYDCENGEFPFS